MLPRTALILLTLLLLTLLNDLANTSLFSGGNLSVLLRALGIGAANYYNGRYIVPPTPDPERWILHSVVPATIAGVRPLVAERVGFRGWGGGADGERREREREREVERRAEKERARREREAREREVDEAVAKALGEAEREV
ncbi:hypothetical protein K490DRAFT_56582 [Saccharata proteae CBS 121410]|uniref:Uncharacterized protein n=1 Tax=Saccharata proteae CBS 121410 TaxID=1314787 RepID=A0A9P4M0L3_9PEZI|nr:hypothetical protein K490DRAFT_56582 [Saccharata proteae CBS 121410]